LARCVKQSGSCCMKSSSAQAATSSRLHLPWPAWLGMASTRSALQHAPG
jgi:hypothetical protein